MPRDKRILRGRLELVQQLRRGEVLQETFGVGVVPAVFNSAALPVGGGGVTMNDSSDPGSDRGFKPVHHTPSRHAYLPCTSIAWA